MARSQGNGSTISLGLEGHEVGEVIGEERGTVVEVGILRDDGIATLKVFLNKIPRDKVREVCIDMKEPLRKVSEEVFPKAKVVVDHFHVIADSNRRMDEARKIEQDVLRKKKIEIPRKIFLIGCEKLNEKQRSKIAKLLIRLSQS